MSPKEMKAAGYSPRDMKAAGYDTKARTHSNTYEYHYQPV